MGETPTDIFIFAGGGTGGHLYPGLAVAEELLRICPAAKIVFACSDRAIDRRILDPLPYAVVPQPVRPLPRSPLGTFPFLRSWFRGDRLARDMVRDLRPSGVLGLGGFAAAPVVRRAARKGVPTGLLNPDAVPGKANRMLARFAGAIFAQFASTRESFPPRLRERVRHVGCPIRSGLLSARREDAIAEFGLRGDRRMLLVLGGSLGAASINEAVDALRDDLGSLGETWQVLHVTGPAKGGAGAGEGPGLPTCDGQAGRMPVRRLEYCGRMDLAYAAADLVLCRAGAVTVAELSAAGKPCVLLPYPYHADRHQRLNASALESAGAGVVVEDRRSGPGNASALRESMLPLMRDPGKLQAMAQAARGLGLPHAADAVARWLAGER